MFSDLQLFIKEFLNNFHTTGAVAPSSPDLAKAILRPLQRRPNRPIKVLEVGPGTGAFTHRILEKLRSGDLLHIFELNPQFYEHLRKEIKIENVYARGIQMQLFNADVRTLKKNLQYDYIISGLPFANFDAKVYCEIMGNYFKHLTPDGIISYFEYILPHQLRLRFLNSTDRQRMLNLLEKMQEYIDNHQIDYNLAWLNLPPARARHLGKKPKNS